MTTDDSKTDFTQADLWNDRDFPSVAIVEKVAEYTNRDPTELRPLNDVIDPDALDRLLTNRPNINSSVTISFMYEGIEIILDEAGRIRIDNFASE